MLTHTLFFVLSALNPDEILKKADQFRSPNGGFVTLVDVIEKDGDKSSFEVFIEGNQKSKIVTKAPARDIGRNVLMINQDMWMFIPSVNRAVRVALRQKLVGQVSQGDISRMRWHGDYQASLSSDKPEAKDGKSCLKLELKATKDNLTYDRLVLWVDAKDYRPYFAEFQTPNGRALKTAEYLNYAPLAGSDRPKVIRIADAIRKDNISEIHIQQMTPRTFPDGFFTQSNLR